MSNPSKPSMPEDAEWLKPSEAAELIGVSVNTLKRLVKEGYVKAYRVEGVRGIQFRKGDVLELLKEVKPEEVDD